MKARERELDLGISAGCAGDLAARCPIGQVIEQRALADPGLAAHNQHATAIRLDIGQQPVKDFALTIPTDEMPPAILFRHAHRRHLKHDADFCRQSPATT